ncbi:MFS transporter [Frondihabitans sp. PAMC 28766]|uniref:MFS transporter n=1 Tax=Frondihabitans sp. PAMC 28766 TaxID=1795630 RepID=UPI000A938D50|nr:MFS transporter [Frondihabitans sp. PAMC 28766]
MTTEAIPTSRTPAVPSGRTPRQKLVLPGLMFVGLVTTAVGSLGAPLLPTIDADYHVSVGEGQWALTISLLAGAIAAPILGRVADGGRRKEVISTALVLVALGCILAALPLGFGWFLAGRALQGVGLGLIPLAITVARHALPHDRAANGIALLGVTTVAGLGIGYPLAGLVVQFFSLSTAFWVGAVITVLTIVAAIVIIPTSVPGPHARLDLGGTLLLGVAVAGLLLVCAEGSDWGWGSIKLIGCLVIGVAAGVVWVFYELRSPAPLVNLRLLAHPSVLAADIVVVLVGAGIYPLLSLVVRYAQTPASNGYGYGYSAALAGLLLLPYSFASFAASRIVQRLLKRYSLEALVVVSSVVLIASMVMFLLTRQLLIPLLIALILAGLGTGAVFAINPAQINAGVPAHETGSANSFYQVLRYIGYSLGTALSATFLVGSIPRGGGTPTEGGYSLAAWFAIIALVAALIAAVLLSRHSKHASASLIQTIESISE